MVGWCRWLWCGGVCVVCVVGGREAAERSILPELEVFFRRIFAIQKTYRNSYESCETEKPQNRRAVLAL
jgi:hypothetical protein